MKQLFVTLLLTVAMVPLVASAHVGETSNTQEPGFMMMRQVEDRALGDELHEEMESLMTKLMDGNLTEAETGRMTELMNQYPGAGSMMMNRMMGSGMFGSGFNSFNNNSMMGYGLGYGFGGGIVMILFWVLVIAGIVALVKYATGNTAARGFGKSALDVLKERYAKGELDKAEFDTKKKDLES